MLRRRTRRKLLVVGLVLAVLYIMAIASAGAGFWGQSAQWCWPWWKC